MKNKKKRIVTLLVILGVLLSFGYYENHHLVVTTYSYQNDMLPKEMESFRIVQLSDLHNAQFGKSNQKLIDKVMGANPDILVLTGDLVDSNHTDVKVAIETVKKLVEICPVYYVTGNHEYWLEENELEFLFTGIRNAGAVILMNQTEKIELGPNDSICIVGLDDQNLSDQTLKDLLSEKDERNLSLVLAHEPQYFDSYVKAGANLVLTGHAHGGQFRLPMVGGLVAPDQGVFPKYSEGEFTQDATTMIISRGIGNSVIPFRFLNDPEIVVVELTSKSD